MLLHGMSKLGRGVAGIERMLVEHGLPGAIAYGVYLGEVVAPVMMILGLGSRIGGALLAATMLFAVGLAHADDVLALSDRTGAWGIELQALYLVGGVCVALLGAGRYSVSRGRGRFD